jgi:hypothetical protein
MWKELLKNQWFFNENWQLFEGFDIPRAVGSLILLFLKYSQPVSCLILIFKKKTWNQWRSSRILILLKHPKQPRCCPHGMDF